MLEVVADMLGSILQLSHERPRFLGQCLLSPCGETRPDTVLKVTIEVLIGIEFR